MLAKIQKCGGALSVFDCVTEAAGGFGLPYGRPFTTRN